MRGNAVLLTLVLVTYVADPVALAGLIGVGNEVMQGEWGLVRNEIMWVVVPTALALALWAGYRAAWVLALGYHLLTGLFALWIACCLTMGADPRTMAASRRMSGLTVIMVTIIAVGVLLQPPIIRSCHRRIRDDLRRLLVRVQPEDR